MSSHFQPNHISLELIPVNTSNFSAFGELISPSGYGKAFSKDEAQLDLASGQPRLYIMRSPFHGTEFRVITRHRKVTQCLGARNDRDWFIQAFWIPGDTAIKLHRGTWHAGPFFLWDYIDFFNLELTDTNQVDSEHFDFAKSWNTIFSFSLSSIEKPGCVGYSS
jgi:ureidoglycolate hydrolase